jgi:hypothetical protein
VTDHGVVRCVQVALGAAQQMQAAYMRCHAGATSADYTTGNTFISEGPRTEDDLANVFDW